HLPHDSVAVTGRVNQRGQDEEGRPLVHGPQKPRPQYIEVRDILQGRPCWLHRQCPSRRATRRASTAADCPCPDAAGHDGRRRPREVVMIGRLYEVVIDCLDPKTLAAFYAELTGLETKYEDDDWVTLGQGDSVRIAFQRVADYQAPSGPMRHIPYSFIWMSSSPT